MALLVCGQQLCLKMLAGSPCLLQQVKLLESCLVPELALLMGWQGGINCLLMRFLQAIVLRMFAGCLIKFL